MGPITPRTDLLHPIRLSTLSSVPDMILQNYLESLGSARRESKQSEEVEGTENTSLQTPMTSHRKQKPEFDESILAEIQALEREKLKLETQILYVEVEMLQDQLRSSKHRHHRKSRKSKRQKSISSDSSDDSKQAGEETLTPLPQKTKRKSSTKMETPEQEKKPSSPAPATYKQADTIPQTLPPQLSAFSMIQPNTLSSFSPRTDRDDERKSQSEQEKRDVAVNKEPIATNQEFDDFGSKKTGSNFASFERKTPSFTNPFSLTITNPFSTNSMTGTTIDNQKEASFTRQSTEKPNEFSPHNPFSPKPVKRTVLSFEEYETPRPSSETKKLGPFDTFVGFSSTKDKTTSTSTNVGSTSTTSFGAGWAPTLQSTGNSHKRSVLVHHHQSVLNEFGDSSVVDFVQTPKPVRHVFHSCLFCDFNNVIRLILAMAFDRVLIFEHKHAGSESDESVRSVWDSSLISRVRSHADLHDTDTRWKQLRTASQLEYQVNKFHTRRHFEIQQKFEGHPSNVHAECSKQFCLTSLLDTPCRRTEHNCCARVIVPSDGSDGEQPTTIQIIACSHHSKVTNLLPLVDFAQRQNISDIGHSNVETNEEKNTRLHADGFGGDEIYVVGSSLDFSDVHFPIGSGPLFSFGMQNEERSDFKPANIRINTMLSSSSLLNVTSHRYSLSENENRFGSLMRQEIIECCVSDCSNHDSGTTMLDVNVGGDLHSLNTSFSSCIRQSNSPVSYSNRNYAQGNRFPYESGSTITSATFTLCTFNEMTAACGNSAGGAAVYIRTPTSLSVSQCSFHLCNVTAQNDDGGAIFIRPTNPNTNSLTIQKSSFTECKSLGTVGNFGGFYNRSISAFSNCAFVECETKLHGTLSFAYTSTVSTLSSLCFRFCSSSTQPEAKDIYFEVLAMSAVSSKVTNCDSTSGAPNVLFLTPNTSDSTLVPQITSTPTVEASTVTFSGNEAAVSVRTKEVIGGTMGILLEGLLVPRLVFVRFSPNGENSTIGTATVSSGANGILPLATYSLRSFVLPGDIGSQLFSASATLKDANTTRITVNGVTLLEGSYSMLVQSTGSPINISLSRTNSATLTGDAPLYPSSAIGRLDWLTQYTIIKVERVKSGTVSEIRRTNTPTFTTPSEPARIASVQSYSLNGAKDEITILFSGFSLRSGTGSIFVKPSDGSALVEGIVTVSEATKCSAVFSVGWEENSTHLAFGKTYLVQSASSDSVQIAIDSGISFPVPSPPVITSFTLPSECSSDSFSICVDGLNLPSPETFVVALSSSKSFEITFTDDTTGTGTVKAGLPSEIQFNTTYSIVSVTKGNEHVLFNQTSLTTPLGPTLETVLTALNASNKNNVIFSLTGSRMMTGLHTLTFVEQGLSTAITVDVSIDTETTGSGEEVVFGGSKLKYGTTYEVTSLTSDTLHFAFADSITFTTPDEPARIVGIWVELDSSGNTTSITVRGRQIAKGLYTVTLNSESGPSFEISFLDDLREERNSSISSVSIFGESHVLSFNTTYTLFSVTPSASPSEHLLIDANPSSFVISEPARITGIAISDFSDAPRTKATVTVTGRALQPNTDYEIHLSGVPKSPSSTTTNTEPDSRTITVQTASSNPSESGSKEVEFYPHDSAVLLFGYKYSVDSVSLGGSAILWNSDISFSTPAEPARLSSVESCSLTPSKDGVVVIVKGFALKEDTTSMIVKSEDGLEVESDGKIEVKSVSECWMTFKASWEGNTTHLEFVKKYTLTAGRGGSNDLIITPNLQVTVPSGPIVSSISAPLTCPSSSFSVGIVGTDLPIETGFKVELVGGLSFFVDFDSSTSGNGTIEASLPEQMQFDTLYSVKSVTKGDRKMKCVDVWFRTPLGPTLVNVSAVLNGSNINNVIVTLESVRMPSGVMILTVRDKDSTLIPLTVSFVSSEKGSGEVVVFGGSTLKYGTTYTVVSLTSSSLHCSLDGTIMFETPATPPRIKTASCSLVGELLRDGQVVLSGEGFPAGTPFSISLDETDENGDVIPNTTPISLSDKFGGMIGDPALNTHPLSITLFPLPQLMKYSCRYRITSLSISGVLTAVEETATFRVPTEPARIVGIWVKLDSSGNTTSITLRGRQIAKGSYTVTLNSESGPSFEISFLDELREERNSSISSVSIFGSSAILSFDTTYTLFSATPISSQSDNLLIDADPNYFLIAEPARVISTFPVLSVDLQNVSINLEGRAFLFTSFTAQLQVTSPTTSSPFTTTATRMSNEELTLTLPILSGTPIVKFGDEIAILSLTNGSTDVILDCSTFVIPHPPKVTSAECRFSNSLHTTIAIELNGTDLPLHTPFLVTLDSGDDFEITFDSTLTGSTAEMAIGWSDSLQYSRTYQILSIQNEETSQTIFVEHLVTFSTGPAPSPIIVFCDSSSSDSSRLCGTSERACSSMDSAWKVGGMTGSLDVSIRIKQNATLSNTVTCLAGGVVVVEKGTFVEPTLRIPWSAWMGEKGMIVVSSDGLFELRDVDVVIESTLPSFVFLFASHSTLIIKDGSFVGPSDSTPSTDNDEDDSDSSVCFWETGILQLENCQTNIHFTTLFNLHQGAINMKNGKLTIDTSVFSDNTPNPDLASAARRNIRCSGEGSVDIKTLSGGDGTSTDPSPWVSASECKLTGLASIVSHPLFVPSLESGSKSSFNKSSTSFTVVITGSSLFPCDLSLEVFEVQKNKAEGKSQLVDLTAESTTSFTESTITLSLSQSQLDLEASLEWRGRLVFGNGARTNSSFVIQQNTADRFAQSVKDNMKWWIPLVVALSAALIVFIFVVVCCLRRQSKKKKDDKLLDPKTSEMDGLPPEKIEIVEDWKSNLPHDSLLGAVQSEGNFSKADTSNDHQHTWISAQETKETGQAESCVDGVVMLEGDAMQLKPVNRQDTLFNRLHSTPKIPLAKLQTAKQIARALTELQKVSPQFTLLSCLSSHFVLFDSNGNVELRLTDGKEGKQADLIQGAQDPPIQPQPLAPVPFHALNHHHISHLIQSELNTLTLTTQPSQESSSGEGFELLRWRAPEATANVGEPAKEFDHGKAAVFSLGLILFEIESETVPLSEMDAVNANRHLGTGHLPKMELIQNDGLFELITSCLSLDPSLRPNLDSIESKLDSVEFSNPANNQIAFC
ncbi:hypothetical protein BLNAU_8677 [Blattamonas nauphoetae]|uniref:Serine-threonine/tyrosine-protein kinase catalytic domain-containing protein n=1 Tax=Blattamonas nauphoetae TaxID=2049346 RepID=A0ABQ9XXU6_9EUKA|nr:hypothetical protein BLNAU_8677 [Blattamonas nauphoetae]